MESTIMLKELEFMTELNNGTLRNYLENYQFNKFRDKKLVNNRWKTCYKFNQEFIKIFEEYLYNKRLHYSLNKFRKTKNIIFDIKGEVNELLGNN